MADETLDQIFGGGTTPKGAPAAKPPLDKIFSIGGDEVRGAPGNVAAEMEASFGKRDPNVDYTKGASFGTRLSLSRANPDTPQAENYLKTKFGEGNYRKDDAGNWLVNEDGTWKPVYPSGSLSEGVENVAAHSVMPLATGVGAALGGRFGGILGAAQGGGGVKFIDEVIKEQQGMGPSSLKEKLEAAAPEAIISGVFQGAGALFRRGSDAAKGASSLAENTARKLVQWFGDVEPAKAFATAQRWDTVSDALGKTVRPTLVSIAPGLQGAEWNRQLANSLRGDKMAATRLEGTLARTKDTFERFGITGPELDNAMKVLVDTKTRLDPSKVGEGLVGKLGDVQAGLVNSANKELSKAANILEKEYDQTRVWARQGSGDLTQRTAKSFEQSKKQFQTAMSQQYDRITQMTGDAQIVNMNNAAREVDNLISVMPPESVPPILRRLSLHGALGPDSLPGSTTFAEAHNLRSQIREMVNSKALEPLGVRGGNLAHIAGVIDDALSYAGTTQLGRGQMGAQAAKMLKETDEIYRRDVQKFTNKVLNEIVSETRAGRPPNAAELVDLISGQKFEGGVKQVWDALPGELQNAVRGQYIDNLLEKATVNLGKGKKTVDPKTLTDALEADRGTHETIIGKKWVGRLHEMADEYRALGGKDIDISGLRPSEFRGALENALGAQKELAKFVESNPGQALAAGSPDAREFAAKYFSGGSDARTQAALDRFGINSPEWKSVQKYALEDLFKNAVEPETRSSAAKISAGKLESATEGMARWSPFQQKALFGDKLPEIRALINDVRDMFPEHGTEFGTSLASASIKSKLAEPATWKKYLYRVGIGWWVDNPKMFDFVAGYRRVDPQAASALFQSQMKGRIAQAMAQAGFETAKGPSAPMPFKDPRADFGGTSGVVPKQGYGGPME